MPISQNGQTIRQTYSNNLSAEMVKHTQTIRRQIANCGIDA